MNVGEYQCQLVMFAVEVMGYFKPDIVTLTFQSFILPHLLNTQAMAIG
jgi:hypothetical protein